MKKFNLVSINVIIVLFLYSTLSAQIVDRTKPPQLPEPKSLELPAIQQFELSNGLKVVLMEKHNVPLIQLNVIVKMGTADDPENKTGLANLTMDLIDEGASGKTALELADEIDFLGARISTNTGTHFSGVYLHTPLSKFDNALNILGEIVLRPDFPEAELNRKKKERLTTIMQWHDQPNSIASITFNKFLFGDKHPYGKTTIGYEGTIKSITTGDVKKLYKSNFKADNVFIVAVGAIKKDELKLKLENIFGSLERSVKEVNKIESPKDVKERIIYLIDKPGSAQSVIMIGKIGASRLTKDYNALIVMNTILGGSFTSRLNNNLREEHGYTYGAGSRFLFRPVTGSFYATSSVQTEVTDKALIEFFKELNGIREPIPEDELNRGKNLVALSYPQNFQTVEDISYQLEEMMQYDLPKDYFNQYIDKMLNVSGDEIYNVAQQYITPDKMIVVVVGDKEKIEAGIRNLNLGEIKNYSVENILGKIPTVE